jgi:SAM-dependent methyltransferase
MAYSQRARSDAVSHRADGPDVSPEAAAVAAESGHAVTESPEHLSALAAYYGRGGEQDRLSHGIGIIEFERTKEIVARHLPSPPAVIADVGGGPGVYALWLASLGYSLHVRDILPMHIDQARAAARAAGLPVEAEVADARDLDLPSESVDAVLLLGPMYHLPCARDRARCLQEARRILRPDGVVFVAAISRWAPRLGAEVAKARYRTFASFRDQIPGVERTGVLSALFEGGFSGYFHRPLELKAEIEAAGFDCVDLVSVEGIAFALSDLDERLANETDRSVLLDAARAVERVPELLGLGPHLLATARRPKADISAVAGQMRR